MTAPRVLRYGRSEYHLEIFARIQDDRIQRGLLSYLGIVLLFVDNQDLKLNEGIAEQFRIITEKIQCSYEKYKDPKAWLKDIFACQKLIDSNPHRHAEQIFQRLAAAAVERNERLMKVIQVLQPSNPYQTCWMINPRTERLIPNNLNYYEYEIFEKEQFEKLALE